MKMCWSGGRGFTLVEMLITVLIVSILASVALPLAELSQRRAKEAELRQALREIRQAIDDYKLAVDDGRVQKSVDQSGYPSKLEVLVEGVEDAKSPVARKIYFLRQIPKDPFTGHADWGLRSYDSPADAPREGRDVFDIYSRSEQTGLNGIPYREW